MSDTEDRARPAAPFEAHPLREAAVWEVYSRPFRPVPVPRVLHHMAFEVRAGLDEIHDVLARFCRAHGAAPPEPHVRHHVVSLGSAELRWDLHAEFATMTLSVPPPPGNPFAAPNIASLAAFLPKPPGPLIVATRLALVEAEEGGLPDLSMFDVASLSVSEVEAGAAIAATDFRPDPSGFTRILVVSRDLTPEAAGALAQTLLDIETYRTLALFGLSEARRLAPVLDALEADLGTLSHGMREEPGSDTSRDVMARLVDLAAETRAEAAAASYRFGATRAYRDIVEQRLASLGEMRVRGYPTLESFLARRMRPALAACVTAERRLDDVFATIERTSGLLRTRVDVELEAQNRDLLEAMDRRAGQQSRLQRTVGALAVAAISYCVISLFDYLIRGGEAFLPVPIDPEVAVAAAVVPVLLLVWLLVRGIRGRYGDD